jgi:hypothetical protein
MVSPVRQPIVSAARTSPSAILPADPLPTPVPRATEISDVVRYEHCLILGNSGSGKTQTLQELILKDLARPDPVALVVIDPKGFMVERIARLSNIPKDRLVIINANDNPAPPLNLFHPAGGKNLQHKIIESFDYIFAQSGVALSSLMHAPFRFCTSLISSIPNSDIEMMIDFLDADAKDKRFKPYLDKLTDRGAQRFFETTFFTTRYLPTKQQIKNRFNDLLSQPQVLAMFSSKSPALNMVDCLAQRKIVLVNTCAANGLDASILLGRYILSLVMAAAFARGMNGPPCFVYIDEFLDYCDTYATPRQFRLCREYNVGLTCALQVLWSKELDDDLRSTLSSTNIKYCAKMSGRERSYMLRDLQCPEELLDGAVVDRTKQLVKFVRSLRGEQPELITIPYPNIIPRMQMGEREYQTLLEENRRRLHPNPEPKPDPPPKPEEPSDSW